MNEEGEIVITWNHDRSQILAVTRQNEEGQILKVIAEVNDKTQSLAEGDWREAFETWWAVAENEADGELCKLSALLGYRAALTSKPQPKEGA